MARGDNPVKDIAEDLINAEPGVFIAKQVGKLGTYASDAVDYVTNAARDLNTRGAKALGLYPPDPPPPPPKLNQAYAKKPILPGQGPKRQKK